MINGINSIYVPITLKDVAALTTVATKSDRLQKSAQILKDGIDYLAALTPTENGYIITHFFHAKRFQLRSWNKTATLAEIVG